MREGRESVKDDEGSGRPATSQTDDNIASVDKVVKEDRNLTSLLMADTLVIPKTVVLRNLREYLKKRKLCSRFVSKKSIISDSKSSRNIEPLPIFSRFVSPNYFLFPKVKLQLKSARFDTNERFREP